jgi:hypothetical protein
MYEDSNLKTNCQIHEDWKNQLSCNHYIKCFCFNQNVANKNTNSSHVRPKCSPPKPPRQHISLPRNHAPRHQQLQKPIQAKMTWVPKKLYLEKQKTAESEICCEGDCPASSFMQYLVRFLALQLKKEVQDKNKDTHSPRGNRHT